MNTQFKPTAGNIMAIILAIAMAILAIPVSAMAATTDYSLDSSNAEKTSEVTAKFTVSDTELRDLGYTTTVSIPTQIDLSYSGKKFTGSDYIGVSGIIESTQTIKVEIDTDNSKYKKITGPIGFSKDLSSLASSKFSESLSCNGWAANACYSNLEDKNAGKTYSAWTQPCELSVTIDGTAFVPRYIGNYSTVVPLTIKLTGV